MKIEFVLQEKILLRTKYIKLISKKAFDKIIIKRDDIRYANLLFTEISKQDLIIRVNFKGRKDFKNDYFFNVSDVLLQTREILLKGIIDDPLGIYNQGYIDNFKLLTDKKEKIKWYDLDNEQKYYYLRGCMLLSGVRENIDNMNSFITIDLSKAKTDLDVYYEIGKAFFNSYGYFGTEINSFIDCLCSIDKSMKKREKMPILKIKGYSNFKKYFENDIFYDDFYQEFAKSGFEIQNLK
ncbi:barstar family protein [Chryseobacterium sp. JJR-5R]|uniref:barstar family protein n=1 Tax=Chryseobacterium sp. JJR-5R TaxID=3093923 RepID=UPI002A74B04D|nr:barstar family protein [Chryseobacterium sp. JJR-5R]WPO81902.1 barstar family protein [Chryseobacterium sp. JJR-5R]